MLTSCSGQSSRYGARDWGSRKIIMKSFFQSKLAHEPDGLIFQPAAKDQAYKGGRDDEVASFF